MMKRILKGNLYEALIFLYIRGIELSGMFFSVNAPLI